VAFTSWITHEWQDYSDADGQSHNTDQKGTSILPVQVLDLCAAYSLGFSLSRPKRLPTAERALCLYGRMRHEVVTG